MIYCVIKHLLGKITVESKSGGSLNEIKSKRIIFFVYDSVRVQPVLWRV